MRFLLFLCILLAPLVARRAGADGVCRRQPDRRDERCFGAVGRRRGHKPLRLSFGSSSTLARQIEQGAPANVFASADEKWMNYLVEKGLIVAGSRKDLLGNDLVLVVPATKPLHVTIGPDFDLAGLLGPNGRLAVGDPAHVPVGIYAKQALTKLGLWDSIAPRLARTDDVRAGLLLVERGEAPAGIVYRHRCGGIEGCDGGGHFPGEQPRSDHLSVRRGGSPATRPTRMRC